MKNMNTNNGTISETLGGAAAAAQAPALDLGTQAASAQPAAQPAAVGRAPNLIQILRGSKISSSISQAGIDFIAGIRKYLAENQQPGQEKIELFTLPYPNQTLALVKGKKAIELLFSEAIVQDPNLPIASQNRNALEAFQQTVGTDVEVVSQVSVDPEDYVKLGSWCAFIDNLLSANTDSSVEAITTASLKDIQLEYNTQPDVYDRFVARNDPHASPLRDDLCLVVSAVMPKDNQRGNTLFDKVEVEKIEVAAIGGYVDFWAAGINPADGLPYFIPEVKITIVPALWHERILELALAAAYDVFIKGEFWKTQFSIFGKDVPNIGNLIVDASTNQPWRCENIAQRHTFIQRYCKPAVLELSILEGRARIPGIEKFALTQQWGAQIVANANQFLAGSRVQLPQTLNPAVLQYSTYTGYIRSVGNQNIDSRYITYLDMMVHHASNKALCDQLLVRENDPAKDAAKKRQFHQDLSLKYMEHVVALDPSYLEALQQGIHQAVRSVNGTQTSGAVDFSGLLALGARYQQGNQGGFYAGGIVNPFEQIFGRGNNSLQRNLF